MNRSVAIYLRVSTEDQARNGYGLGDQEVQCRKYIDIYYPEYPIVTYKDDGYSGKDLKRPMVQEMLKEVDQGNIAAIVIFKLDRLSRSVVDTYNLIDRIINKDCALIAVLDRLDITSANGRMFVGMLSLISQWEREVIQERTIAGMNEMAREGKYPIGATPYGWKKNDDFTLVIDEEQAFIINQMAEWLLDGYTVVEISEMLLTNYHISKSVETIKSILKRRQNIGEFVFQNELFLDIFPPIMDQDKFEMVQSQLKFHQIHSPEKINYLFHGLIYCDKCRKRLEQTCTIKPTKDIYYYYFCRNCGKRCNQKIIERQTFSTILLHNQRSEYKRRKKKIDEQLKKIKTKEETLFNQYCVDLSDQDEYIRLTKQLERRKERLVNELKCYEVKSGTQYQHLTAIEKYDLIHQIVSKIILDLEHKIVVKIEYKND